MLSDSAKSSVQAAIDDLAYRAGVTQNDVIVSQIQAVEWPDASLGCPQPHRAYAQTVTRGYVIILGAISREYEYHADEAGRLVYCGKRIQG